MSERKYEKYIVTDTKPLPYKQKVTGPPPVEITRLLWLDDEVAEGAFYTECVWVWRKTDAPERTLDEAHTHEWDEVIGFIGSNPEDPYDLCGEVELWLGDEQYNLTKSCLVFIPRELKHCPVIFRRVDRPIMFFTEGNSSVYKRESE